MPPRRGSGVAGVARPVGAKPVVGEPEELAVAEVEVEPLAA